MGRIALKDGYGKTLFMLALVGARNAMRTMHLFAGVGGGLLADLILGHTPVVAVEWEPYACKVLRERAKDGWFPELRVWEGDVRLFDPSEYAGSVDCIHAGFPCQDISVTGKQAGVGEETRSGLYREVLRISGVVRPKYLFLENVAAIVSNGLETVISDLIRLGYDSEWLCLRASDCGANHHRDRWWLLANSNGNELGASQLGQNAWTNRWDNASWLRQVVSDTDSAQRKGKQLTVRGTEEYADISCPGWWAAESTVGRVANGVPNRIHRLKGLGNAQVPLQAAVAWKHLGGM
jgi:DNA (cytosine-5)-methyltransferase 1